MPKFKRVYELQEGNYEYLTEKSSTSNEQTH